MLSRTVLVAALIALVALSLAPSAEARPPVVGACLVGGSNDDPSECVVTYWTVQCVTFPCSVLKLCVGFGAVCV